MAAASRAAGSSRLSRLALAVLPLATGAALVAYILGRLPLSLGAGIALATGAATWVLVVRRMSQQERRLLLSRVRIGIRAGVPALVAYDATRFGLVAVASMSLQPFGVWQLFGHALLGPDVSEPLAFAAGMAFHAANGLGFAVAFALVVRNPTWRKGIAWAFMLEAAMLALYPGWLGVPLAGELLPVSLAGHFAYGSVLGLITHRNGRVP